MRLGVRRFVGHLPDLDFAHQRRRCYPQRLGSFLARRYAAFDCRRQQRPVQAFRAIMSTKINEKIVWRTQPSGFKYLHAETAQYRDGGNVAIDIDRQITQALIEHLADAVKSDRAHWAGHNFFYLLHRSWLTTFLDSSSLPAVMYPSKADLEFPGQHTAEITKLGRSDEALLMRYEDGSEQVWVRASSTNYRTAMRAALQLKQQNRLEDPHDEAVTVLNRLITEVEKDARLAHLTMVEKEHALLRLRDQVMRHEIAASVGAATSLFDWFDSTLDADHLFSAAALTDVKDAWVWLFPVPSNANRNFGLMVEKYYKKLDPDTDARYISSIIIYKALASAMPANSEEHIDALDRISKQLGNSPRSDEHMAEIKREMALRLPRHSPRPLPLCASD